MNTTLGPTSLANITFTLNWQSEEATHTERMHVEKFNVWRDLDLIPANIQREIINQPAGHEAEYSYAAGELIEQWPEDREKITVTRQPIKFRLHNGMEITPRLGRFYPRGLLQPYSTMFSEDMRPLRYVKQSESGACFDLAHPLQTRPLRLGVKINKILPSHDEHGGRCNEIVRELLHGPGMKVPLPGQATDFLSGTPYVRADEQDDAIFYRQTRMVHHLDAVARKVISNLSGDLIPEGAKVLDLMSSWESHLTESLNTESVTGLGMNREELENNPRLQQREVQDLNKNSKLPFEDASFDAVICTASVEYLTQPEALFSEVLRVLKPGGRFINSFSNRWFPTKAVAIWSELHEYERPALVSDYYRKAGFTQLHTFSEHGEARPIDDPHIRQTQVADPVHAVWGERSH